MLKCHLWMNRNKIARTLFLYSEHVLKIDDKTNQTQLNVNNFVL